MVTSIQIQDDTWERLKARKGIGDTHDDIVNELLDGISGDAHDRLLWYKREEESLSDALDRVMMVMPGPGDLDRAGVDAENLESENFVFLHLPTPDGNYRTSVYRDPGQLMSEQAEVLESEGS